MKQSLVQIGLGFGVVALSLGLGGCGGSSTSEGGTKTEKQFLSVGTAPPGGTFFVIGNAIAQVVESQTVTNGWKVTGVGTKGTQENIRRLDKAELDFAMSNAAIAYFASRGEGKWETKSEIRAVMTMAPNVAYFITPANSDVKTMADLKGKRVVVGPAGAGFEHFIEPILKAHGVSYDDFSPINATQQGAVNLLADGAADAAFLGGGVPTASITQACSNRDMLFVPFDTTARDQLVKDYPFFAPMTVAAEKYPRQTADYPCLNVGSMQLISHANVSEETVYLFTKSLYENRADVVKQHPAGKAINPKNIVRDTGLEFHPGAVRYYKEIGIWPDGQ